MLTRNFLIIQISLLVVSSFLFADWWQSRGFVLFGNIIQVYTLVFAAVSLTRTAALAASRRIPWKNWGRLAGAMWMWVFGQCLEALSELMLNLTPYGTVADGFWLLGFLMFIAGFAGLILERKSPARPLQGVGISVAIVLIAVVVLAPHVSQQVLSPDRSVIQNFLDIAYPVLNLAVTFCVLVLFFSSRSEPGPACRPAWAVFALAFALGTALDALWGSFTETNSLLYRMQDLTYFVEYSCLALAALMHLRCMESRSGTV